jgi:hypothetical protein
LGAILGLLGGFCCPAGEILRFEAEDWTTPTDAWIRNRDTLSRWNLWSRDVGAKKKWSGGVVLRSPAVTVDRHRDAEGAPALHSRFEKIPNGTYDVYLNGTRNIGISRDGKTWQSSRGGLLFDEPVTITDGRFELWVDDRFVNPNGPGACYYDYLEFRPAAWPRPAKRGVRLPSPADYPPVRGWAKNRREEALDRGVVALATPEGVYLSWRLLKSDPANAAFDVYCRTGGQALQKLNREPIVATTDFVHKNPPTTSGPVTYRVCPAGADALTAGTPATLAPSGKVPAAIPYLAIKLKNQRTRFQKIALADLNGDGQLDYVIKYPNGNVDPYIHFWKPSSETYKLEAYLHDGTYLWTRDLGWSIERGIWYSPYVVADLDGDGKAEIAVKTGEGDPRDQEGRVKSGPEWLTIWDGLSGRDIAKTAWPSRTGFLNMAHDYNYYSRNQLAVAYLDGKTPCIIALRGTYNLMKVDAFQLRDQQLERLWSYSNEGLAKQYWGQGEHFTHAVDVDGDGRDEVLLGSVMLDDTGCPLWTTGLGHNDAAYVSDILPERPGLEIFYIIESRQRQNGMCLADARTGQIIWGYDQPTTHIHSAGMCADIDPLHAGLEGWGADSVNHKIARGPWLWSAKGELLAFEDPTLPRSFDIATVFWDGDLQKECLRGKRPCDYRGGPVDGRVSGTIAMIADVVGDWREEIITSAAGEIRLYSTTLPAMDRRVCLLQDPIYRADVRMDSMGYRKIPSLSYCPAAQSPNLNLTLLPKTSENRLCRVVVSAPLDQGLQGTLSLVPPDGRLLVSPDTVAVALKPGQIKTFDVELSGSSHPTPSGPNRLKAILKTSQGRLCASVATHIPKAPRSQYHTSLPRMEAEAFSGQGGGQVKVRADKAKVSGRAISHWDRDGHWLEWRFNLREAARYALTFRYCTPNEARRQVTIDGQSLGTLTFPATGGFGDDGGDWLERTSGSFPNSPELMLEAGPHVLRLTNPNDTSLNLDFIGYRKLGKPVQ